MAHTIEVDWEEGAEGGAVRVVWITGAQASKSKVFPTRAEAEAFAMGKMNRRNGMIISNLDLTPAQRQAQAERKAKLAAAWDRLGY